MLEDTIAAIATPLGEGGIAIVRVSGREAVDIVEKVFRPVPGGKRLKDRGGYTLGLGWIVDRKGNHVDEVLVTVMRGPKSYTAEDVVEINCHGGVLAAIRCLETVLENGARLAEPGEFTKRAFLNGRLDISQAEAVIDIIRAKTEKGMSMAVKQLEGMLRKRVAELEDRLVGLNTMVEASIDFPEEVGDLDEEIARQQAQEILRELEGLLRAGERNRVYQWGVKVVIAGKPNVGKSSLLNALLRKKKAIVTDIPGTTRDIVEDYINVKGIPVNIMDTAGIRETGDLVERIGVERSEEVISEADIILAVLDAGAGISEEDERVAKMVAGRRVIVLVNKEDLEEKRVTLEEVERLFPGQTVVRGSVKEEIGLEELESAIEEAVLAGKVEAGDEDIMVNLRQEEAFRRVKTSVEGFLAGLETNTSLDCLAVDIGEALEALGEITGKTLKEDVIERIFRDYCIGK